MKVLIFLFFSFSTLLGCVMESNSNTPASVSVEEHIKSSPDTLVVPSAVPSAIATNSSNYQFPYQLAEPNQSFKMPNNLEEISGLCITPDNKSLYSVQDEKGNIYKIDLSSGEITKKIGFGKNGDYEGIAYYQNTTFITKSNGTIYEIKDPEGKDFDVTSYKTDLKNKNDIEGLCYHPSSNSLLIACKGIPTMGETTEESANRKSIYRFDLKTKKLIEKPFYKITLKKVQQFLKETPDLAEFNYFQSYLKQNNSFNFNPSGIAIHPKTKEIYILSSSKKMLLIINEDGEIQYLAKLNKKMHRQPEGIAFGEDGTLYISNEGKGGRAKIHVYAPRI